MLRNVCLFAEAFTKRTTEVRELKQLKPIAFTQDYLMFILLKLQEYAFHKKKKKRSYSSAESPSILLEATDKTQSKWQAI